MRGQAIHFHGVLEHSLLYDGDATVYYYDDDLHRLTREYCSSGGYRTVYDYRYSYDEVWNPGQ